MRKSLLLCAAAVSALALGGPVLAQSDRTPSPGSTSATTSTSTVTGTVVSSSDTELVIDTATGRQRFVVEPGTSDVPASLAAGTRVTVEFRSLGGDRRQVARVTASPQPGASTTSSGTPTPGADTTSGAQARDGNADPDDEGLPATASPVGLAGLLGLLSLGAATAVSAWRRLF